MKKTVDPLRADIRRGRARGGATKKNVKLAPQQNPDGAEPERENDIPPAEVDKPEEPETFPSEPESDIDLMHLKEEETIEIPPAPEATIVQSKQSLADWLFRR